MTDQPQPLADTAVASAQSGLDSVRLFRDYLGTHPEFEAKHYVTEKEGELHINYEQIAKDHLEAHPDLAKRIILNDAALKRYLTNPDARNGEKEIDESKLPFAKAELASYPGVIAIAVHDIAHEMYKSAISENNYGDFVVARYLAEKAHSHTGIDIHPGAKIGENLFIDHGTGVVIGEEAQIEAGTTVYHGSTLGAIGQTPESGPRHPHIGKDCTISVGAKVLGFVTIGDKSVVGANATVIGNGIRIGNAVSIGPNSGIGDRGEKPNPAKERHPSTIGDGVKIGSDVKIGDNVQVDPGIVIGNCVQISEGTGRVSSEEVQAALADNSDPRIKKDGSAIPANYQVSRDGEGKLVVASMYVQRVQDGNAAAKLAGPHSRTAV